MWNKLFEHFLTFLKETKLFSFFFNLFFFFLFSGDSVQASIDPEPFRLCRIYSDFSFNFCQHLIETVASDLGVYEETGREKGRTE